MKFITQIILMMLSLCISVTGQIQLEPIDSSHAKITTEELKFITTKFIELDYLKAVGSDQKKEIGVLKNIVADKDGIISIQEDQINLYKQQIEDQKPAWWNKFWIGGCVFAVIITLVFSLIK